jgi:hypothetical protein
MGSFKIRDTETSGESGIFFRLNRKNRNTGKSGRLVNATDNIEEQITFEDNPDIRE